MEGQQRFTLQQVAMAGSLSCNPLLSIPEGTRRMTMIAWQGLSKNHLPSISMQVHSALLPPQRNQLECQHVLVVMVRSDLEGS